MSNKTNVVEELTFEEYWERYSCASDTPKMAARAAWILAIKQEKRLQEIRLTQRAPDVCPADGGKHSWHPNKDNYLIYSCRKCGARG